MAKKQNAEALVISWIKGEAKVPPDQKDLLARYINEREAFEAANGQLVAARSQVTALSGEVARKEATTNLLGDMLNTAAGTHIVEKSKLEKRQKPKRRNKK